MQYANQTQQVEWTEEHRARSSGAPVEVESGSYSSFSQPLMYHRQGHRTISDAMVPSTQPSARVYEIPDKLDNGPLRSSYARTTGHNWGTSLPSFEYSNHAVQDLRNTWQNSYQNEREPNHVQVGYARDQNRYILPSDNAGHRNSWNCHNDSPLLRSMALFGGQTDKKGKDPQEALAPLRQLSDRDIKNQQSGGAQSHDLPANSGKSPSPATQQFTADFLSGEWHRKQQDRGTASRGANDGVVPLSVNFPSSRQRPRHLGARGAKLLPNLRLIRQRHLQRHDQCHKAGKGQWLHQMQMKSLG